MEQVPGDKLMTEAAAVAVGAPVPSNGASSRPKTGPLSRAAIGTVLQYWKAFDLDSKRVMLDTQGGTMKTEKDNSLRSRKKLAETTKNFRKLPDPEKVAGMGGLLRAYQEEIDNLTRRAKYSENAFFLLYKGLYAAPDPVPSLESINDMAKSNDLEEENKKLKRELYDYEVEFSSLKNQEITIRKLEEQLSSMEHNMEDVLHQKVAEKCKDLEEQLLAKSTEFAQQQMDYERQLEQSRRESRDALNRLDALQSELFAQKQRSGHAKTALDAEMDLVSQEAIMMQTLRLENTQLKKQIDYLLSVSSDTNTAGSISSATSSSVLELSQKETTIVSLRQEVLRLKETAGHLEYESGKAKERYEDLLQQAKRTHDDLTAQLAARPTMEKYNDLLHQLRVLQQLEYNIVDEEEHVTVSAGGSSSSEHDASHASSEIEKVLVARVRRLEHTLQQRELVLQEKTRELESCQREMQSKTETIREQSVMLRRLEETVDALESRRNVNKQPDVGSEILMDAVEDQLVESSSSAASASGNGGIGADSKMFEIVRGQRDRFRERMKELQAENNKMSALTTSFQSQVTRLEQDNMQLYQKIRYLQSYQTGGSSRKAGGAAGNSSMRVVPGLTPNSSMYDLEDGSPSGDVESRYKSMYDEKMNPFQQFNKIESQQRYTNLNTVDKILLNSAKIFLGHRITRNIAFGYIVLLHFLVFTTLYTFMHGCGISNDN